MLAGLAKTGTKDQVHRLLCFVAAHLAMLEAEKGFRRLKAYKQLPRAALDAHYARLSNNPNKQMLDEAAWAGTVDMAAIASHVQQSAGHPLGEAP